MLYKYLSKLECKCSGKYSHTELKNAHDIVIYSRKNTESQKPQQIIKNNFSSHTFKLKYFVFNFVTILCHRVIASPVLLSKYAYIQGKGNSMPYHCDWFHWDVFLGSASLRFIPVWKFNDFPSTWRFLWIWLQRWRRRKSTIREDFKASELHPIPYLPMQNCSKPSHAKIQQMPWTFTVQLSCLGISVKWCIKHPKVSCLASICCFRAVQVHCTSHDTAEFWVNIWYPRAPQRAPPGYA